MHRGRPSRGEYTEKIKVNVWLFEDSSSWTRNTNRRSEYRPWVDCTPSRKEPVRGGPCGMSQTVRAFRGDLSQILEILRVY